MLLVNCLKDKVDNLQDKFSLTRSKSSIHYHKKKSKIEPKLLFLSKSNDKFFQAAEDGLLSEEDIIKRYTKERLHQIWEEKVILNFNFSNKKFSDEAMSNKAKEAKEYIKSLVDPDRFETKLPKWDISTKADNIKPPLLKQSLFKINSKLSEWGAVPLHTPHIEEGVDSRHKNVNNSKQWYVSTQLIQQEKDTMLKQSIDNDKSNTSNYWRKNEDKRKTQAQFRISEERKRLESPRYYQQYHNPTKQTKRSYDIMNKIKEDLWIERERIRNEVLHDNPGCRNVDEKINALVEKKMYKTYKEKFRVATGKQKDMGKAMGKSDEHGHNKNVYHWNDIELAETIHTISNWKDIKWFKSQYPKFEFDEVMRQKLLETLMIKGEDIHKELEFIQEKRVNDKHNNKLKFKAKRCQSSIGMRGDSIIKGNVSNKDNINDNDNDDNKEKDFLNAYKKCALEQLDKQREEKKKQRPKSCVDYNAYHPGVYKTFVHKKNPVKNKGEERLSNDNLSNFPSSLRRSEGMSSDSKNNINEDIEYYTAWSCCLNTNKLAPGCRKELSKRLKWNYDNNFLN